MSIYTNIYIYMCVCVSVCVCVYVYIYNVCVYLSTCEPKYIMVSMIYINHLKLSFPFSLLYYYYYRSLKLS